MAKIIKKSDALEQKYRRYLRLCIVGGVCALLGFCVFALSMLSFGAMLFLPCAVLLLGGAVFAGVYSNKAIICKRGIEGERITAGLIQSLPDSYVGFQNLTVSYDGKRSELDMVVVGPTGVWIIETKNMTGSVFGNYDSPMWTQRKEGRQGASYTKTFYNPIKQVSTHTYRLAHLLRDNGFSVYVKDMVYFANPETVIQLLGAPSKTPVFSALANTPEELLRTITDAGDVLAASESKAISAFLDGYTA